MRNVLLLAFMALVICNNRAYAQRYKTEDIIAVTDRTLKEKTDAHLVKCFSFNKAQSFYQIKKREGKFKFKKMPKGNKALKKKFYAAHIVYDMLMPYGDCKPWDTIKGRCAIDVKIDSVLLIDKEPDLRFIPNFVSNYAPCNFISAEKAIQLALDDGLKSGITPPYAFLKYQPERKRTVWVVLRTIWNSENFNNDKEVQDDMVIIDAANAWILQHKVIPFAPHLQ
jgi:hypothetical protein